MSVPREELKTPAVPALDGSAVSELDELSELPEEAIELARSLKLTPRMVSFAEYLVQLGGRRIEAARRAGYTGNGWRNCLVNPRWLEYLEQRTRWHLAAALPLALSNVMSLAGSARSESVRLSASQDILNRGQLVPVNKHLVGVAGGLELHIDLTPPSVETPS